MRLRIDILLGPVYGCLRQYASTHPSKHDRDHWRRYAALQRSLKNVVLHPPLLEPQGCLPCLLFLLPPFLFLGFGREIGSHRLLGNLLPRGSRRKLAMRLRLRGRWRRLSLLPQG